MNSKLKFITKSKYTTFEDVSLTLVGKEKNATSIIFRNNIDRNISKTGYVTVAICGERLYFKEEESCIGYKIANSNSKSSKFTKIRNEELNEFTLNHSGDYRMQYDKELNLYYIDTEY